MSGWVAGAIAVTGAVNAYVSSNAANNAASGARDAANQANATNQAQYDQTRADATPWRNAGGASMNQLAYLMGLPGYGPQGAPQMGQPQGGMNGGASLPTPGTWSPTNASMGPIWGQPGSGYQPLGMATKGGVPMAYGFVNQMNEGDLGGDNANYGGGSVNGVSGGPTGGAGNAGGIQGTGSSLPYNRALGGYGSLATPFSQTNWQADPGYAFRLAEGQKALERSASARGMTLSGAQQKALLGYGQGMGAQEYNAAYGRYSNDQSTLFNRLSGIAGSGQQSNQYNAGLGAQNAATQGQNTMNAATTQANAGLYNAGQWGNALNQGTNLWMNYVNGQQQQANRIG